MKEMVEDFEELFQKGMKLTQKWKQKMGMRGGYRKMGYREGRGGQDMRQMDGYQEDGWFDPRYM